MHRKQQEAQVGVIRAADVLPGLVYPYLPREWAWEIHSIPFACWEEERARLAEAGVMPTLRLVKDDKVLDIHVPGMDTAQFMAHWGLTASLARGGYVLAKRLSRLMHPHRYWGFFNPDQVRIVHRRDWNGRLWDGCGRVSRRFLEEALLPRLADLPVHLREACERELLHTGRFEVTVMHAGGQEKGDILVVDDLPGGADFMFPYGSAKAELSQQGQIFVGLPAARHAKVGMRLDVQSLINLHPFLEPEQLLEWVRVESGLFLEALESGRAGRTYSRLAGDEAQLEKLADWHVAEYLASGGDPRWFAGITRELGKQHLNRLVNGMEHKLRLPAPGGRFYIFPAAVGGRAVPRGHIELDRANATAWVNDADWQAEIVRLLGGCDGDDALWVLPFTDRADEAKKVLCWRSPNQLGEYVLLKPTATSDEIRWAVPGGEVIAWPPLDSRSLPPRVDEVNYAYDDLAEVGSGARQAEAYHVEAMDEVIELAMANQGVLGAFCNLTLVTKALYGRLPERLPATLETIIDGSVKKFINLTPVREWVEVAARAILAQGKPVPRSLAGRLLTLLPPAERPPLLYSEGHWLDELVRGLHAHQAWYEGELEERARQAMPPIELFAALSQDYLEAGRVLRHCYGDILRCGGTQESARQACDAQLARHTEGERSAILLAAAACCYTLGKHDADDGFSDNVLWQLGERLHPSGRKPGIAQAFIQALREAGLLGEPVWTAEGAQLYYRAESEAGTVATTVTLNGVWLNLLRATNPELPPLMAEVPAPLREEAKATVAQMAGRRFNQMELAVTEEGNRLLMHTPRGNLFGYVQRGHEHRVRERGRWRIAWATALDGNVHAVLQPAE